MALGTAINDSGSSGFPNANNDLQTRLDTIYGSQATWQPLFQTVFDRWSAVSGLSYQYLAVDDGAAFPASGSAGVRADVRIGGKPLDGNSNVLAYNYFPNTGDMVLDTSDSFFANTAGGSIGLRNVVAHEHGHGLGMPHVQSNNSAFLMEPFVNTSFDGPQYHDILAAHHMYGDAREKTNAGLGNDVVTRANPLGAVTAAVPVSIGNSARTKVVSAAAADFVSIDSQTDTDFYSFSVNQAGRISVLLEALGFDYNVTVQSGAGGVSFDTRRRADLALALFAADGTTLLQLVNLGGLGDNESLDFDLTDSGTYYLRITGADNPDTILLDTQFYSLSLAFLPVPEPALTLLAASAALGGGWAVRRPGRANRRA